MWLKWLIIGLLGGFIIGMWVLSYLHPKPTDQAAVNFYTGQLKAEILKLKQKLGGL